MKKKGILIFGIATFTLAFLGIVLVGLTRHYPAKYFFYLSDRITGTITVSVDGKEYVPVEGILNDNSGTHRLLLSDSKFSLKGGNYGVYKISFELDNEELFKVTGEECFKTYTSNPFLTFKYFNTNWWHVTKMTLTAEIVLVNDEWVVNVKVVYSNPSENGSVSEYAVEEILSYDDIVAGSEICFGI